MRRKTAVFLVGLALVALSSCASPCDKLATITCEKVGQGDTRCEEAQRRAKQAGSAERAACARVLKIYEAATE